MSKYAVYLSTSRGLNITVDIFRCEPHPFGPEHDEREQLYIKSALYHIVSDLSESNCSMIAAKKFSEALKKHPELTALIDRVIVEGITIVGNGLKRNADGTKVVMSHEVFADLVQFAEDSEHPRARHRMVDIMRHVRRWNSVFAMDFLNDFKARHAAWRTSKEAAKKFYIEHRGKVVYYGEVHDFLKPVVIKSFSKWDKDRFICKDEVTGKVTDHIHHSKLVPELPEGYLLCEEGYWKGYYYLPRE